MAFFARPDLSNEQFKQLEQSTLTLSGQTQIATISGLTLSDGSGGNVIITASGASVGVTDYHVLAFDPTDSIIKLMDVGSGGTSFYNGNSPATIDLGGISAQTVLTGRTVSDILSELLTPTVNPTVVAPSSTFTVSPQTPLTYEVGCSLNLTGFTTFSRGSASPWYSSGGTCLGSSTPRSGLPTIYCYTGNIFSSPTGITSTALSNTLIKQYSIGFGSNTWSSRVFYSAGNPIYNSCGGVFCTALPTGNTQTITRTLTGIYPYYWGKVASGGVPAGDNRPSPTASLITGGTKVVQSSTGTIVINYNSTSDDYIWFALPVSGGTNKTCWFVNALNNGNIGGSVSVGGNLFPSGVTINGVNSPQGCWNNQPYKLYISNYQTSVGLPMELRNS